MNADSAQHEGDAGERSQHAQLRDARRQVAVDEVLQGLDVRQRHLGVGPLDDRAHGGHERERITGCANGEVLGREPLVGAIRQLSMRKVDLRLVDARQLLAS